MLQIIEIMLFMFVSVLLYFILTLFYIKYKEKRKEKKIIDVKKHLNDCILKYKSKSNYKLDNRLLKNRLGLVTLVNFSCELNNKDKNILNKIVVESKYFNYIVKSLKTSDLNQLIFNVKLIGELEIKQFNDYVFKALNKSSKDIYLQYNVLLALAKLNDVKNIKDILLKRKLVITERALKNVLDILNCDKAKLYKELLDKGNDFIKKTTLYQIGFDNVKSLENNVIKYLDDKNTDLLIAAISACGNLKSDKSLQKIKKFISSDVSDVRKECIIAMNLINDADCTDEFIALLGDNDWQIKYTSAMALCDVKDIKNILVKVKDLNDDLSMDILKYALERRKLIKGVENDERIFIMHSTIR